MTAAPGWYPDPSGAGRWLWWDGRQWLLAPAPPVQTRPVPSAHRWPWTRWATVAGLGVVAVASWATVASGVVAGISFEPDAASLFQDYATAPLRNFGWPAALLSTVAVVAAVALGRRRWVVRASSVAGAVALTLVTVGLVFWQGRAHPEDSYRQALATLSMPGFTDLGIHDATPSLFGPPEAQHVWTTSSPPATACGASAAAIEAWADAGSARTTELPDATNVRYCSITATHGGDSVSAVLDPESATVPSAGGALHRVVVTLGPPTGL